ncbi:single-stranded DNA-binding protein [Spirochaeta africana]|uniref:Single-stranded DNA-binding protein n=1 Tax=Spirochaeta africana (strain ATCC 700263 / DSM 8902 / Z-7692) TaxID=889378 RepID=H9UM39_SPIAZ|nr:single-stranded DNA-binding protein [Spirochaeta africana]AFG38582.1 single stranded DNA-binding protein [Spirochaeta africana DSM 8902]
MNSLNSILLEGNLTRDPVLKETPKGSPVCEFSVASNRFYRMDDELQKEVSFFDVETWNKVAERCGGELAKGRGVRVIGRLKQNRWVATDGSNRSRVLIVADHVEFKPQFSRPQDEDSTESADVEEEALVAAL